MGSNNSGKENYFQWMQKVETCDAGRFEVWPLNFLLALLKLFRGYSAPRKKKVSLKPSYEFLNLSLESNIVRYTLLSSDRVSTDSVTGSDRFTAELSSLETCNSITAAFRHERTNTDGHNFQWYFHFEEVFINIAASFNIREYRQSYPIERLGPTNPVDPMGAYFGKN